MSTSRSGLRAPVLALALGAALLVGIREARAGEAAAEPTVAELLTRIEALEKALAEVKRDATSCEAPPQGHVVAGKKTEAGATAAGGSETGPVAGQSGVTPTPGVTARRVAAPTDAATAAATDGAAPATAAEPAHVVAGYKDGFFLSSADGSYRLNLGGYVQADSRFFIDDHIPADVNQFTIRRARLDFHGTLARRFVFRLMPDFAGSKISLTDAYVDADVVSWLHLRAGKFKTPFGIERLEGATGLPFVERGLPDNLVPSRDVGLEARGEIAGGVFAYQLAVMNGVPDGSSGDVDVNDGVDVAARVFAKPFVAQMYSPLRGAGFGVAGTWGKEQGSTSNSQLPKYQTAGRSTFFSYVSDNPATSAGTVVASGDHYRLSPQATWYEGSLGFLGEYVRSAQQVALASTKAWVNNDAWQLRLNYVLTGEKASYDSVEPEAPFDFGGGHWGAWEVATRWSSLDVDADAFAKGFADPTQSARHADAIAAAVNWYLNRNVAVYLDYDHTMFRGGSVSGDRSDEDVVQTRVQVVF